MAVDGSHDKLGDTYEGIPGMHQESDSEDYGMLVRLMPDAEDRDAEMIAALVQLWSDICMVEPGGDCSDERNFVGPVGRLGGSKRKHNQAQRDRSSWMRRAEWTPAEVYSPPRVIAMAKMLPEFAIWQSLALDLTTVDKKGVPWDIDVPERREEARRRIARERPMFLSWQSHVH